MTTMEDPKQSVTAILAIVDTVAKAAGVEVADILPTRKAQPRIVSAARDVAIHLAYQTIPGLTVSALRDVFGYTSDSAVRFILRRARANIAGHYYPHVVIARRVAPEETAQQPVTFTAPSTQHETGMAQGSLTAEFTMLAECVAEAAGITVERLRQAGRKGRDVNTTKAREVFAYIACKELGADHASAAAFINYPTVPVFGDAFKKASHFIDYAGHMILPQDLRHKEIADGAKVLLSTRRQTPEA